MHTEINGTIKIGKNKKVLLEIAQNDLEKFKEHEHFGDSRKFYAVLSLNGRQLYITGFFGEIEKNQQDNTVTILVSSANEAVDAKALTAPAEIKLLFDLDNKNKEVKVQMLKCSREQIEESKSKIKDLEAQLSNRSDAAQLQAKEDEIKDLKAQIEDLKEANIKHLQQLQGQLNTAESEKQNLETAKQKAEEALETKTKELETQLKADEEGKNKELEAEKLKAEKEKAELQTKFDQEKQALEDAKKEAEEKQQELQTKLDAANTKKTVLQKQLDDLKDEQKKVSEAIDGLFTEELNGEIKGLIGSTDQDLKDKVKGLYDGKLKSTIEDIIGSNLSEMKDEDKGKLHEGLQIKIESIIGTDQSKNVDEIVESIKEELKDIIINASKFSKEVADLKVELEAKNKTTEQPKQGNEAKYTATVGMGLAAGLIAFTALERTVRLEMLVMIGTAVVSALVAGGITYAALPSTQVDGAKAQEVNENGKKK
ncbi:MAG: hypothetical protein O7167_05060 [Wolbachia endosymbiont of Andrena nigroaenea]|nr:hypothetical protein [Wolbachia endosymbiont of Andrena nigroaenea]